MNANRTCTATFNVNTASAPSGTLVASPKSRCTVDIQARIVSSIGITDVTWKLDTIVAAIQQTPVSSSAGLFIYRYRQTLVDDGTVVTVIAHDAAGQAGTIGPFVTACP
jgi:hypothetical protein